MNNKPRNIIFDLLLDFSSSNKSFKIIIDKSLKSLPELNKTDKKFITNISKGILRYKTVLEAIADIQRLSTKAKFVR